MSEENAVFKWLKLDNAAKIYPAAMSKSWTALFRLSATLSEPIDPKVLEEALSSTVVRLPSFALRLRKGFFWYYLEHMQGQPEIQQDVGNPCVRMRLNENNRFMFRVRYYENRIAVEIFHVLTDGTGGLCFLNTLVAEYLRLKYKADIPRSEKILDCYEKPQNEEFEDSFLKYARSATLGRGEPAAYHIKGTPEDEHFMNIITAIIPADELRQKAKEYSATLNEFLTAVLLMCLQSMQAKEVSKQRRKLPLKVSVPVNMRKFYASHTLRNFASYVNPWIDPTQGSYSFEEIVARVKHFMGLETTEKQMNARISANVASEKHALMRGVPLLLKSVTMKTFFYFQGDRCNSVTLSNLGNVKLPEEMEKYVKRLEFIIGPLSYNPVTCACVSYDGTCCLNFTSTIKETTLQRYALTTLVKMGIHVKVESNQRK